MLSNEKAQNQSHTSSQWFLVTISNQTIWSPVGFILLAFLLVTEYDKKIIEVIEFYLHLWTLLNVPKCTF